VSIYKFLKHPDRRINNLLKKILQLHPDEIHLSLDRIKNLLKKLNNPQNKLPHSIHVAGTNGKGSVATSLYYLQKLNGKKVHVYRSPHLFTLNERIIISNKIISNNILYHALKHVYKVNNNSVITFFEFFTASAFYIFSNFNADLLICEVGLGGHYDATNILNDKKKSCIITPICYDHKEFLGNNIKNIAKEKSGILKKKNILICSNQKNSALNIIKKISEKNNCRAFFYGKDWIVKNKELLFENKKINLSNISLEGDHQFINISCAIMACYKVKQLKIEKKNIPYYISQIKWEGRLEKLNGFFKKKYPDTDCWVDCAHNPQGFDILKKWILRKKINSIYLIVSLGIKKDYTSILRKIRKINPDHLLLIRKNNFSSRPIKDISVQASILNIKFKVFDTISDSIRFVSSLKNSSHQKKVCLITGSINLVGEALALDKNTKY